MLPRPKVYVEFATCLFLHLKSYPIPSMVFKLWTALAGGPLAADWPQNAGCSWYLRFKSRRIWELFFEFCLLVCLAPGWCYMGTKYQVTECHVSAQGTRKGREWESACQQAACVPASLLCRSSSNKTSEKEVSLGMIITSLVQGLPDLWVLLQTSQPYSSEFWSRFQSLHSNNGTSGTVPPFKNNTATLI